MTRKPIVNFEKSNAMSRRLQEIIPGGAHTYSKGADQSPLLGPKVIDRGLGSHVFDVDGNEYVDWAMGLTSVSLGHAHEPVLEAVRRELVRGSNFQCPSPLELEFAECVLQEIPGAEMVKFAKNGSTVTTAAVKLARAFTGRKYVAFCSDHGFFSYDDWYMGLKPNSRGVPPEVAALSLSFRYNDMASVQALFDAHPGQVACVILEPMEFDFPENEFLQRVRDLCAREGAIFVLDEMITGFRLGYPGAHRTLKAGADLMTWGKGMANGFSVCMLTGRKDIMELGGINHDKERVFLISTTHGAETHALAAAKATLKELKEQRSVERVAALGTRLKPLLQAAINAQGLEGVVTIKGHPAWQLVQFRDTQGQLSDGFKTLVFQEMAKNGVLFRGTFTPTISHSDADVAHTLEAWEAALGVYKKACEAGGYEHFLVGEPVKPVFRKWN